MMQMLAAGSLGGTLMGLKDKGRAMTVSVSVLPCTCSDQLAPHPEFHVLPLLLQGGGQSLSFKKEDDSRVSGTSQNATAVAGPETK